MVNVPARIGKSSTGRLRLRNFRSAFSDVVISVMQRYYVRVGSLAEIHVGDAESSLRPGRRVLVRTVRGVELGWVVSPLRVPSTRKATGKERVSSCRILRPTTPQDELLLKRLQRRKRQAVEACRTALRAAGSSATLLDVDQIFDGGTLVMHFLGPTDGLVQEVTRGIVEEYESVVRSRHFAKLLHDGCGPGCGTSESAGCTSGACHQCARTCGVHNANMSSGVTEDDGGL